MRPRALVLSVALALGGALGVAPVAGALAAPPAARPPTGVQSNPARLSHDLYPTAQSIDLNLDPSQKSYSGAVNISIRVATRCDSFQFNARSLEITRMVLSNAGGEIPVTHALSTHERITVRAARPLEPGAYRLEIEFSQGFGTRATSLYHVQHGDDWYSFTDFEAMNAREAFPCWDEPEFKIPWQVKLTVPAANLVLSNTPIEGTVTVRDRKTVSFEQTPPLSSYLVAFMCGPFDEVPVPGPSIPTRIITLRGQAPMAAEAARQVPPILEALEGYFGRPYPYQKLDFIAVPEYLWGAMENPGAITFVDHGLLMDPAAPNDDARREMAGTIAHELSHMWFGDLVTMKWWDDVWLNESFASWLGDKITQQVFPKFNMPLEQLDGANRAYAQDGLVSTHAMRQHVGADDDVDQLFDALAYDKGEAVLGMFEQWIGPDVFRKGVLAYLAAHAWGNAEGADLWNELSKVSGLDVAGAMATFLDQPGVPIVRAKLLLGGEVELSQQRYFVAGESAPGQPLWKIPVTLRFSDGSQTHTQRVLLTEAVQRVKLVPALTPQWLHPNANQGGYYHWEVSTSQLSTLAGAAREQLNERERVGYVQNLNVLLAGGSLHGDDYLHGIAAFADDPSPRVTAAVVAGLESVRFTFVTSELRPAFSRFVARTLRPVMDRIGETPQAGENVDLSTLRAQVMAMLGWDGGDKALCARAYTQANDYLNQPASLHPTLIDAVLKLSAVSNDSTLYDRYRARYEAGGTPEEREHFLASLGWFHDPRLVGRTLDYALHGPLRPQDIRPLLAGMDTEELRQRVWDWARQNYAGLSEKLPAFYRPAMVRYANGCSRERLEAARLFFSDPAHAPVGTERELSELGSRVTACAGLREREGTAVARALQSNGARP
ncbi:MAG: M1 family metallopeptidase [Candidatus Eiseniibacteriota bacterium]